MSQLICVTSVGEPPTPNSCDPVPPFQIVISLMQNYTRRADRISLIFPLRIAEEGLEDTNPALPLAVISKPMPTATLKETLDMLDLSCFSRDY